MTTDLVAVTGAAGKTGRAVTAALSRRGVPVRALVHREDQAAAGVPGATEALAADLADRDSLARVLDGVGAVYVIAPNMHPDEPGLLAPLLERCETAGPRTVVYHSVIHPYAPAMPHHVNKARVEARLQESGLDWAILQPASYFENALGVWDSVRDRGVWPLPYSERALFSPVALTDVADVAAQVLTGPAHRFATYELAGPEWLTTADMAAAAVAVLGRDVRVEVDRTPDPGRPASLQAMFDYYDKCGICGNSTVLAALLGRAPVTWHQWVARHR